jgi:hypothetical protein
MARGMKEMFDEAFDSLNLYPNAVLNELLKKYGIIGIPKKNREKLVG